MNGGHSPGFGGNPVGQRAVGRVAGIPLGLHYSWFIIAALITLSLSAHFRATQSDWAPPLVWGIAALTAALFFVTLLLHELSHAVMARARGIAVRSITLFALGGIAQMERDANSAKSEFLIAVVGPIASFLIIGFACLGVALSLGWSPDPDVTGGVGAGGVLGWLGSINILLAVFFPGYPLDGGRILRAILWGYYGDGARATRSAASASIDRWLSCSSQKAPSPPAAGAASCWKRKPLRS